MSRKIGIIGGSGLYRLGEDEATWQSIDTPFGQPSSAYLKASTGENTLFFLPRHGTGHTILPSEINHRANIHGFKQLGVTHIISVTAVGSLKEEIRPGDLALPDQYFDRSKNSAGHTFFGGGVAGHVPFGQPVSAALHELILAVADEIGIETTIHQGGTYVNMEGPAFSTRAESNFYRSLDASVIGMTSLAEAKLAREAEIAYAPISLITDYDCWRESSEDVTADLVAANAQAPLLSVASIIETLQNRDLSALINDAEGALAGAIMTAPDAISEEARERLQLIAGPYLENSHAH